MVCGRSAPAMPFPRARRTYESPQLPPAAGRTTMHRSYRARRSFLDAISLQQAAPLLKGERSIEPPLLEHVGEIDAQWCNTRVWRHAHSAPPSPATRRSALIPHREGPAGAVVRGTGEPLRSDENGIGRGPQPYFDHVMPARLQCAHHLLGESALHQKLVGKP